VFGRVRIRRTKNGGVSTSLACSESGDVGVPLSFFSFTRDTRTDTISIRLAETTAAA
jgi:hypothetical protein